MTTQTAISELWACGRCNRPLYDDDGDLACVWCGARYYPTPVGVTGADHGPTPHGAGSKAKGVLTNVCSGRKVDGSRCQKLIGKPRERCYQHPLA